MLESNRDLLDLKTGRADYGEKPPSSYHIYFWTIGDGRSPLDVAGGPLPFGDVVFNFYGATETGLVTLAKPQVLRAAPYTIDESIMTRPRVSRWPASAMMAAAICIGGGEATGVDPFPEQGVTAAGDPHQRPPDEALGADLRVQVPEDAELDVQRALPQRGAALQRLGQEDHVHVRCLSADPLGQGAGELRQEQVGGLHGEGALQVDGLEPGARPQHVVAAPQQRAHLVAEFDGPGCGDEALPRPDQERIADGATEPGQGAAGGRGGGAEPLGGARHAVLLEQSVQDAQQVEIHGLLLSCIFA